MAKKGARQLVGFVCTLCRNQNYISQKNKTNTEKKLTLKKYCRYCRKHTEHKETQDLD